MDHVSPTPFRRLLTTLALTTALLSAGLLSAGCTALATPGGSASVDPSQARQQLDTLKIGTPQPMTGYSRDRFPHWIQQGNGCDTREVVLKRDGTNVSTGSNCHPASGQWYSQYDGKTFTDPNALDIDHMVPLADAWRSGANAWTDDKRSQFANDLTRPQLLAVSATSNRAKGDQDPSQWKPPNHAYWCQYAERWVAVKAYWQLTVTQVEKVAIVDMLGTCQWPSSAPQT